MCIVFDIIIIVTTFHIHTHIRILTKWQLNLTHTENGLDAQHTHKQTDSNFQNYVGRKIYDKTYRCGYGIVFPLLKIASQSTAVEAEKILFTIEHCIVYKFSNALQLSNVSIKALDISLESKQCFLWIWLKTWDGSHTYIYVVHCIKKIRQIFPVTFENWLSKNFNK